MKFLSYILLFFYCNFLCAFPPIIQRIMEWLCWNCKTQETILLSEDLKFYLEQRLEKGTEERRSISNEVILFDISMVGELGDFLKWQEKCWSFNRVELEEILYKFYIHGECVKELYTIDFLNFCLSCYFHIRQRTEHIELKSYLILYRELKRINQISKDLRKQNQRLKEDKRKLT